MNIRNFFLYLGLSFLLVSCGTFRKPSELDQELAKRNVPEEARLQKEANERLLKEQVMEAFDEIRRLIAAHKLTEAENLLARLRQMTEYQDQIQELQALIDFGHKLRSNQTHREIDQQTILDETQTGLRLPKNYSKRIQSEATPLDTQPTQLELLLDRTISAKISGMSLAEFAMQLRDIEGLNIADPVNIIFNDEVLKGKTFTANFKNVPLSEVFDYISYNLGVDFNIKGNIIWVTKAAKAAEGPRLITKIIPLPEGIIPAVPEGIGVSGKTLFESTKETDTDLESALKAYYAKIKTGGSYTLFAQRNLLLVCDTLANIREVEKIVKAFSRPPAQVLIEAKFLTVSQTDLHDVGVELSHYNGGKGGENITAEHQTNTNVSDFFTQLGNLASDNAEGVGSLTISGIIGNRSYDILLRALEKKTSTVTLSAPRITALNNRTARIRKGDKMYYFEEYKLQSVDNGDKGKDQILVPTGKPVNLPLGITFDVKPSIGSDGKTILLGIKPEIITFIQWEDFASTKTETVNKVTTETATSVMLPRTNEQTVATSVALNSGETVILGGMVENRETSSIRKIPILGDIPYLGALFRHVETSHEPTNLLIFVTATIIKPNGDYAVAQP